MASRSRRILAVVLALALLLGAGSGAAVYSVGAPPAGAAQVSTVDYRINVVEERWGLTNADGIMVVRWTHRGGRTANVTLTPIVQSPWSTPWTWYLITKGDGIASFRLFNGLQPRRGSNVHYVLQVTVAFDEVTG